MEQTKQVVTAEYSLQIANFVKSKGWIPMPLQGKNPICTGFPNADQETGYN